VGLVDPKFAFLNIGFEKMFYQFRNQHYENRSYVAVFVPCPFEEIYCPRLWGGRALYGI